MWSPDAGKKSYKKENTKLAHFILTFHAFAGLAMRGQFLHFLPCGVISPT